MPNQLLDNIQSFINEAKSTNSLNKKIEILKKYPHLKKVFTYMYNPDLKYGVTPASLLKRKKEIKDKKLKLTGPHCNDLMDLLKYLTINNASNKSRDAVLYYINIFEEYEDLIMLIMNKSKKLDTKIGADTALKVYPDLYVKFAVSLGFSFKNGKKYFTKSIVKDDWFISRKYDGVRCIARCSGTYDNPKIKLFSRYGKPYSTLKVISDYIANYVVRASKLLKWKEFDLVFDGEIVVEDEKGNEDFTAAVSEIRRKDIQMKNPKYRVFDLLTNNNFDKGTSDVIFSNRIKKLTTLLGKIKTFDPPIGIINMVEQFKYTENKFEKMKTTYNEEKWEGLILRKDDKYSGKRSKDILKVKRGGSKELKVVDITTSTKGMLENGIMVDKQILAAATVGNIWGKKNITIKVDVGSGFSDAERIKFFINPKLIIGKVIRVNYMDETPDGSLRHPVYDGIVGEDERDV